MIAVGVMVYAILHPLYFLMSSLAASSLGEDQLAGFGLGSLTIGIVGISIAVAFNSGLLTFTSAASGQKDYRACMIYRNRTIFLDICIYALLSIPIVFIEEIYMWLGQQPVVAMYAAKYCKIVFPSIIFFFIFYVQTFYASAIHRIDVPVIATLLGTIIQYITTMILVNKWGWGYSGLCWPIFFNFSSRFVFSWIMLGLSTYPEVKPRVMFISKETVRNLGHLFKLCLSSCFMTVWLSWAFDVLTLMSTYLNKEMIAAQTIMRTVNMIAFVVPISFQVAAAILVGKSIGEKSVQHALRVTKICLVCAVIGGLIVAFCLHRYR
jgi:Na+-driven multidrug efflux pump